MPKCCADTILKGVPKLLYNCDQVTGRICQEEYIIKNSFITSFPCDCCTSLGEVYMIDRTCQYSKCASCTRQGQLCKKDFHTKKEWDILKRAKKKITSELSTTDDELELLYPKLR